MDQRKPVSVFKSICWCIFFLVLSIIIAVIIALILGFIIGWLINHIGFINKLLSYKWVFFLFMTAATADIGRRTSGLIMRLFNKAIIKSRSVGKGFLGAGILLVIYCVIGIIATILRGGVTCFDLTAGGMGVWYIIMGRISEEDNQ